MARNKRLALVEAVSNGQVVWQVIDRETGLMYAVLYPQNDGGYRVRLSNYPHRMSKRFGDQSQALRHVEKEVF